MQPAGHAILEDEFSLFQIFLLKALIIRQKSFFGEDSQPGFVALVLFVEIPEFDIPFEEAILQSALVHGTCLQRLRIS